jgi:threonine dehydrogenase-like Zn-dependent dehydrogenase
LTNITRRPEYYKISHIYYGPGGIRIEERSIPEPGVDGVVVKVKACGVCGFVDLDAWGTLGPRMPMWQGALELIQAGTITADKYVTHVFPLEKINEAFETAMDFHKSLEVQIEL